MSENDDSDRQDVFGRVCAMADAAAAAQADLAGMTGQARNALLLALADALIDQADQIAAVNEQDCTLSLIHI